STAALTLAAILGVCSTTTPFHQCRSETGDGGIFALLTSRRGRLIFRLRHSVSSFSFQQGELGTSPDTWPELPLIAKLHGDFMKKHVRMFAVLSGCVLALGIWAALYGQNNQDNQDNVVPGSYLTTVTDANTGAFASRSVITLHADHTLTVIDS